MPEAGRDLVMMSERKIAPGDGSVRDKRPRTPEPPEPPVLPAGPSLAGRR